jgi:hypothetical protein
MSEDEYKDPFLSDDDDKKIGDDLAEDTAADTTANDDGDDDDADLLWDTDEEE